MKMKTFPHPGNTLPLLGGQLGQKASFRGSEESAATGLWQAEQKETSTDGPSHLAASPSLRRASAVACSGWFLKLRLQQTNLEKRLELAAWRQPEGAGVWLRP